MATIYFIEAPKQNLVKVGRTNNIDQRFATLESMSPVPLRLRGTIDNVDASLENRLHKIFADLRRHGEWFEINEDLKKLMDNPESFDIQDYAEKEDAKKLPEFFEPTDDGDYKFVFGKHYDELLSDVIKLDYPYIDWILWQADFPLCVKELLASILDTTKK